jgi:transposase
MEQWRTIRRRVLVEGVSKRQILRETGMHRKTLEKILGHSAPPGYQRSKPVKKPKIGPYLARIRQILEADREVPRKQRHTAKRIWERLQTEAGFEGGYTVVKDAVRDLKARRGEVFMPLVQRPGDAQVDFGFALARMAGVLRKIAFFVMSLPYSDAAFVMTFPRECTETFWEGHVRAFAFFGFVPPRIRYDNSRVAVQKILGAREREFTVGFQQLMSHYLFNAGFCRVRRANEKGVVEGMVKYARQNFLVPVPQVQDFEELNRRLEDHCNSDLDRRLRGHPTTKRERLAEDRAASLALPVSPFPACRVTSTFVNSESLVRFDGNDYSVPVDHAHQPVVVKGFVDRVEVCRGHLRIAEHTRCWEKEQQIFEPRHYLRLLERKPGSLDDARPLDGWSLPACFGTLRRRLEHEQPDGTREFIRVLRLLEDHPVHEVTAAVRQGLRLRTHSRDAIAQYVFPTEPWGETCFRLDGREHLRHVRVAQVDPTAYRSLLQESLS